MALQQSRDKNSFDSHIRVAVALALTNAELTSFLSGRGFGPDFIERVYEHVEEIRRKIILPLNEEFGDRWAVRLKEMVPDGKSFIAEIYCDDHHMYDGISRIMEIKLPDYNIQFFGAGAIEKLKQDRN